MAVSVASYLVRFPEFLKAGEPMLAAALAEAELQVSDSFGDVRDAAVMLRLADNLALSPWGRDASMVSPAGKTSTYGARFERLAIANAVSSSRLGSSGATTTLDGDG